MAYIPIMETRDDPTIEAIARAGGAAVVARAFGITSQAVSQWRHIPIERVRTIEALSGISRYELRPDIFGEPPARRVRGRAGEA